MDIITLNFEALKLVRDWSTWLVGINIAIIGGIFSLMYVKESIISKVDMVIQHKTRNRVFDGRHLLLAGVLCLGTSVGWASNILAGLPNVVLQLSVASSSSLTDIYALQIQFPFPSLIGINVPLWFPIFMQNATFSLGTFLAVIYLWSLFIHDVTTNDNHSYRDRDDHH